MHLLSTFSPTNNSLWKILSLLALITTLRIIIELSLLDYSSYIIELGIFSTYTRFFLENLLYFITLFILLVAFVAFLTKRSLLSVSRFGVFLLPFIVSPPLVDYFIFGRTQNYIYGHVENYVSNILTLSWKAGDTSAGVALLVTGAAIAITGYTWFVTRSTVKALIALLGTSTIIMTLSTPDLFFGPDGGDYGYDYFIPLYYLIPSVLLWGVVFFYQAPKKLWAILHNLRPERTFPFVAAAALGYATTANPAVLPFLDIPFYYVIWVTLSIAFAWWFAIVVNDIADREIDAETNTNRPLPQGILTLAEYKRVGFVFAFMSLAFAASLSLPIFIMALIWIVLGLAYSLPPVRLRMTPLGNVVIGIALVLSFVMGMFTTWSWNMDILMDPLNTTFYALLLLFGTLITLTKDLKDISSDKKAGVKNIYTLFGKQKGKALVSAILFAALNTPLFVIYTPIKLILFLGISGYSTYLYYTKEDERVAYISASIILILSFVALYYGV